MAANNKSYGGSNLRITSILLVLAVALVLRIYQPAGSLLWEDEAETALNSIGILDTGMPSGFFRGIPMFESPFLQTADSQMYEFSDYNYFNGLPRYHGWLPFYPIALSFNLFGASAFAARLPSVIFSMLSLVLAYRLCLLFFNRRVATISIFLIAVNPVVLFFERQARYHAIETLLVLSAAYFFYLAFTSNKNRDYAIGVVAVTLLFYTHMLASFIIFLSLALYRLATRGTRFFFTDMKFLMSSAVIALFVLPWFLYMNLAEFFTPKSSGVPTALEWGALAVLLLAFLFAYNSRLLAPLKAKTSAGRPRLLVWIIALTWIFAAPLLVPRDSLHVRLFEPLVPLAIILAASYADEYLLKEASTLKRILIAALFLATLAFPFVLSVATLLHVDLLPYDNTSTIGSAYHYVLDGVGTDWLKEAIAFLKQRNATNEDLILATYNQYPLAFHTDYKVQLAWAVRKDYIDSYQKKLFIIEEPEPFLGVHCMYFYKYYQPETRCGKNANYQDKIALCSVHKIGSGGRIYECN